MTNIFSRQQRKLIQRGFTPEQAAIMAYKKQQQLGNLVPGTFRLSDQGKEYSDSTTVYSRNQIRKQKEKNKFGFKPSF